MASAEKRRIEAASFSADTVEFIRLLAKHSVRYIIVGGQSVIFHGYARFTGDVDFFYSSEVRSTGEATPGMFPSQNSSSARKRASALAAA
jgi:hypothetical protein